MYINTPYKLFYNTENFPFNEIVKSILEVENLENLHLLKKYELLEREKDQKTTWHKLYYSKFENEFKPTYLKLLSFIKTELNNTQQQLQLQLMDMFLLFHTIQMEQFQKLTSATDTSAQHQ